MRIRVSTIRLTVQALFFFALVYLGVFGVRRLVVYGYEPSLPTLSCEYGRHVAKCFLYDLQYILSRDAASRYASLLEPVLFFLALGALFGRAWCGWACPIGFLQDLLSRARAALGCGRLALAARGRAITRNVGIGLLVTMVALSILIGLPTSRLYVARDPLHRPYCQICPGKQLIPLVQGRGTEFLHVDRLNRVTVFMGWLGIASLGVFVFGSLAVRQFWCRFCALGILMDVSRLNRWCVPGLQKDLDRCTHCGNCARVCPVDIQEVFEERESEDVLRNDCHLCLKCVEACPEDAVLTATYAGKGYFRSSFRYFAGPPRPDAPTPPAEPPQPAGM